MAINDYNKAIELNPNYSIAYNNRGNSYWRNLKIAYNSLKSYWIWRRKKEAEEKEWRELGVDENIITELHDFDRIASFHKYLQKQVKL